MADYFSSFNPYTQQLQPSIQQAAPTTSPYLEAPLPTKDDMLGQGNTSPISSSTGDIQGYPSGQLLGMGGSVTPQKLPTNTIQAPVGQPGGMTSTYRPNPLYEKPLDASMLMPGGWQRRPETRTGGIMTQSHPDFIGRRSSDQSGGVRPGALPNMSAVAAARAAQQASFNRPPSGGTGQ